ncbi:hypothetical protein [Dyella jiangningensis]
MDLPDLWPIEMAVQNARRYAKRLYNTAKRADDYDAAKDAERIATAGESELRKLSIAWNEIKSLKASRDRAYDEYVTNQHECCSCHISAPCSYCTRELDEDEQP